ncbi:hypothetical protein D1007_61480 [Hordeum vulgare]|nr:hypothetical protein D1007_61480 [Hordeum vulgare]
MCTKLTLLAEEGRVARTETVSIVDWNVVELDEPSVLVIAPIPDIWMARPFGIPVDDRDKERGESSLPTNVDENVDGQLMEEAADVVHDAHDDELVHVYDIENPIIAVGKLFPNMDEFMMCFKTSEVKHEFDAKTVWIDRNKFYARCRGFNGSVNPYKWYISSRLQPDGSTVRVNHPQSTYLYYKFTHSINHGITTLGCRKDHPNFSR